MRPPTINLKLSHDQSVSSQLNIVCKVNNNAVTTLKRYKKTSREYITVIANLWIYFRTELITTEILRCSSYPWTIALQQLTKALSTKRFHQHPYQRTVDSSLLVIFSSGVFYFWIFKSSIQLNSDPEGWRRAWGNISNGNLFYLYNTILLSLVVLNS